MPHVISLATRKDAAARRPAIQSKNVAPPVDPAVASPAPPVLPASRAALTISSRNYSSWSLRGWLMARFAGLDFDEVMVSPDDVDARQEILLLAPSIRVPCLTHDRVKVWDTLAIGEYLNEVRPESGLLPDDLALRAHCRAICGEMNSGFANLRSALPMNLKVRHKSFKIWAGAQPDVDRIFTIWRDCLERYGGPYLFGPQRTMADALFAPVVTRFVTYAVPMDAACAAYAKTIAAMPEMKEWTAAAVKEAEEIEELDMEF